jgi:hypothetical protein
LLRNFNLLKAVLLVAMEPLRSKAAIPRKVGRLVTLLRDSRLVPVAILASKHIKHTRPVAKHPLPKVDIHLTARKAAIPLNRAAGPAQSLHTRLL